MCMSFSCSQENIVWKVNLYKSYEELHFVPECQKQLAKVFRCCSSLQLTELMHEADFPTWIGSGWLSKETVHRLGAAAYGKEDSGEASEVGRADQSKTIFQYQIGVLTWSVTGRSWLGVFLPAFLLRTVLISAGPVFKTIRKALEWSTFPSKKYGTDAGRRGLIHTHRQNSITTES